MSSKNGNLQIIVSGALVGIGLVAVATAIFTQLPIGSKFVKALRQGSERQSGARIAAPHPTLASTEAESTSAYDVRLEPELPQSNLNPEPEALPSSITITKAIEISMGIGKIAFEVGNILTVTGKGEGVFLCDYLGDTVEVPISATNWESPTGKQVDRR
ncbi:MAG: hypothetical protein DRP71_10975 [Verrucomicrobia bacterium]|nr:MAG: hypothetical protein DRP71_10975 [Verrucomicrobiota bacterium]